MTHAAPARLPKESLLPAAVAAFPGGPRLLNMRNSRDSNRVHVTPQGRQELLQRRPRKLPVFLQQKTDLLIFQHVENGNSAVPMQEATDRLQV